MVYLELIRYGDFDIPYTDSVWKNPEMDSFPGSATLTEELSVERDVNVAYAKLVALGFFKVRAKRVTMGGGL